MKKSYIDFIEVETNKKTKTFNVISKTDGSKLGEIKWHPAYRSYALFVTSEIYETYDEYIYADTKIFDTNCQKEITMFCEALMAEWKKQ